MTGLALRVRGVHKSYDAPVLAGLDLDVPVGALVALLGPSGCGKTTLLRVVAGFERIEAGTVEVGGQLVAGCSETTRDRHVAPERRRVGIVPQEGALFPHLSVHDNVAFGLPRPARRGPRPDEVLELVGLAGLGARMPHELSGGQQQRVAIARALCQRAPLLLADEPVSALDPASAEQVLTLLADLAHTDALAVLCVLHQPELARRHSDRVIGLLHGQTVFDVPAHALPPEQVAALYESAPEQPR